MILNHRKEKAGVLTIPCMGKNPEGRMVVIKTIRLLPGHNEVDDKDWAMARNEVLERLKSGDLIEIGGDVKEGEKADPKDPRPPQPEVKSKPIGKMSAEEVVAIVQDTYDQETLEKWLKKESRDEVRAEIKSQIEKINKPGEKE